MDYQYHDPDTCYGGLNFKGGGGGPSALAGSQRHRERARSGVNKMNCRRKITSLGLITNATKISLARDWSFDFILV